MFAAAVVHVLYGILYQVKMIRSPQNVRRFGIVYGKSSTHKDANMCERSLLYNAMPSENVFGFGMDRSSINMGHSSCMVGSQMSVLYTHSSLHSSSRWESMGHSSSVPLNNWGMWYSSVGFPDGAIADLVGRIRWVFHRATSSFSSACNIERPCKEINSSYVTTYYSSERPWLTASVMCFS